jgi:hypothetical protein
VCLPRHSQYLDLAGGGRQQPVQDFDGRGLAGSIRAQETKTFAGLNCQVEAPNSFDLSVVGLPQAPATDGILHIGQ